MSPKSQKQKSFYTFWYIYIETTTGTASKIFFLCNLDELTLYLEAMVLALHTRQLVLPMVAD